ncbi:pilus assembly protein CpaF [Paucidesulfovibrio gracilis DSM 16080]|uniref:Pilus assembly protein CpaF n=1 Tax=Paucidesulfovibrio gracilis DSM 16080 TaxID=1121449 RepID=A0A1T4XN91_9BACT|nr:CpaF family protein [Paucidesulfovibrio gracilis]SKA90608.1 pilus assembly protein CpaF [Paucidesulfovibrio gracilis DSM 16080]
MSLADRLQRTMRPGREPTPPRPAASTASTAPLLPTSRPKATPPPAESPAQSDQYYEIKTQLHARLIDLLDLGLLETLAADEVRTEVARLSRRVLAEDFSGAPLNRAERDLLIREIQDEVLGLGPLEPFIQDPTVNDILVNSYCHIYVERGGKLQSTRARFKDNDHLKKIIDRIVSRVGRRIDESSPMVDARLEDGSRVNAVIPPLAIDGPSLSIRKFSKDPLEVEDLIAFGSLTPQIARLMEGAVRARLNVIISGGTGSGKTTLLNCLSRFIPTDERIVTIEDAAELQLKQEHVVRLETRPANIEGRGEVTQRDLVKNCLRMRPDRIIVGEVRSSEALDMLQAMNTGHDGSLTTIHANTPRDCLMRLETMVSMAGLKIADVSLRRYIASAVDVIIQASRLMDGSRKVTHFTEITGMEGDMITIQDIFTYAQTGVGPDGKVRGAFRAEGIRPAFSKTLEAKGIPLDPGMFQSGGAL